MSIIAPAEKLSSAADSLVFSALKCDAGVLGI
jgi:hypothetical protein